MSINYVHFDTAQREDLTTDSFSCELKLANPLRNVKKIYLKSAEIPVGFFNIRKTQYFEYVSSPFYYENLNSNTLRVFAYKSTSVNNYNVGDNSDSYTYTPHTSTGTGRPVSLQQQNAYRISIEIIPGNYTILSLLNYINDKLYTLFILHDATFKAIASFPNAPQFELITIESSDTRIFPVGYVRAKFNSEYLWFTQTEFNYKYLGFTFYRGNFQRLQSNFDSGLKYIDGLREWNMHHDLCLYLYLENIPQTNTHFKNNLASFKIPIKSGYQAIEYNTDNISFAQNIENTDVNYILDKVKLKVYDRDNNIISNNGLDFKFTLAIET